jgi:hypothetical protein
MGRVRANLAACSKTVASAITTAARPAAAKRSIPSSKSRRSQAPDACSTAGLRGYGPDTHRKLAIDLQHSTHRVITAEKFACHRAREHDTVPVGTYGDTITVTLTF